MAVAVSTSVGCGSPLDGALTNVAATGAKYVDVLTIGTWAHVNPAELAKDYPTTSGKLRDQLARHKLTPIALNTGTTVQLHDRRPESAEQRRTETDALCRMMKEMGIMTAAIQPLGPDKNRPWPDVVRDAAASLREQYAVADRYGVRLAVELHVNSPFETVEQAQRLFDEMPEVRVVYDPTHFVMQGMPLRETTWIMDRAIHVHARDAAKGKIQTPLGEGEVDFDWMTKELMSRGYAGHVSIEYLETNEFDAVDSARQLLDVLSARLG